MPTIIKKTVNSGVTSVRYIIHGKEYQAYISMNKTGVRAPISSDGEIGRFIIISGIDVSDIVDAISSSSPDPSLPSHAS